jgi:hypothetical protein
MSVDTTQAAVPGAGSTPLARVATALNRHLVVSFPESSHNPKVAGSNPAPATTLKAQVTDLGLRLVPERFTGVLAVSDIPLGVIWHGRAHRMMTRGDLGP